MTPARWGVLAAILAASAGLQSLGLDRQAETKAEERYRRVADIPASDMVPTYVASLFFGAFRAIVVDALWIQLKKIEEEHRWYEQRQIMRLIAYFQPRNPEVWAHLGWHSAYNIANGFTDPEKSWGWIKFGLSWLREGNAMLPDSPYLKFELARTLYFKPTWREGILDRDLLSRIQNDPELQELLRLGPPRSRPLSAFELAVPWLERGRDELLERTPPYVITQTGLYIRPLTLDGFIREALYFQAIYLWQQKRWDEAREAFERLREHTHAIVQKEYKSDFKSPIFADEEKWSERLPEIVDLDRKAQSGSRADELALLEKLQSLVIEMGPLDRGFLCNRDRGDGRLDRLKRKLSGDHDRYEWNDTFEFATPLPPQILIAATLEPLGLDVDFYQIWIRNPDRDAAPDAVPPRPIPLSIHLGRPGAAPREIKATLFDSSRRLLKSVQGSGELRLEETWPRYEMLYLKVEPADPSGPGPDDTSYTLRYQMGP